MIVFNIQANQWTLYGPLNLAGDFDKIGNIMLHIANFDNPRSDVKRMNTLEMLVSSLRR
jgi:hypothetical protein